MHPSDLSRPLGCVKGLKSLRCVTPVINYFGNHFILVKSVGDDTLEPFSLFEYLDTPDLQLIKEHFWIDS